MIEFVSARVERGLAVFVVSFGRWFAFNHVFLETDLSDDHRFRVEGHSFGASYMLENNGLWQSRSPFWKWRQISGVEPLNSYKSETCWWQVSLSALGVPPGTAFRALAHGAQEGGKDDEYGEIVTVGP